MQHNSPKRWKTNLVLLSDVILIIIITVEVYSIHPVSFGGSKHVSYASLFSLDAKFTVLPICVTRLNSNARYTDLRRTFFFLGIPRIR